MIEVMEAMEAVEAIASEKSMNPPLPIFHMGTFSKTLTKYDLLEKRKKENKKKKQKQQKNKGNDQNKSDDTKYKRTILVSQKFTLDKVNSKLIFSYNREDTESMIFRLHMFGGTTKTICNRLIQYKKHCSSQKSTVFYNQFCQEKIWEADYKKLKHWYIVYIRRRFLLKIVLHKFLVSISKKYMRNTDDPCTLMPPVKKIICMDINRRCCYQFDAKSLQKLFMSSIGYNDWLFPLPLALKNPLTNMPFHDGQLISAVQQLRGFNCTSWMIESYIKFMNQKEVFRAIFYVPLTLYGIQDLVRNPTSDTTQELLEEFVESEYEYHNLHTLRLIDVENTIWAIQNMSSAPSLMLYIQKWLKLFQKNETYKLLRSGGLKKHNIEIHIRSYELIKDRQALLELKILRLQNLML